MAEVGHLRGDGHPRGQPFPSAGVRMGEIGMTKRANGPLSLYSVCASCVYRRIHKSNRRHVRYEIHAYAKYNDFVDLSGR